MNRMSSLIVRQVGSLAPPPSREQLASESSLEAGAAWLEDLKLFALGWLGGLVFFGTLLS
jgi:hypothetical protein